MKIPTPNTSGVHSPLFATASTASLILALLTGDLLSAEKVVLAERAKVSSASLVRTAPKIADFGYVDLLEVESQVIEQLHCRHEGTVLEKEKRGFDSSAFRLSTDARVLVTLIYDGAARRNTLGWYPADNPEARTEIWHDVATGPDAPLEFGSQADLGLLPSGTDLRFYLQQDGARGGRGLLFQDADLNPAGMEQVAARFAASANGKKVLVMGFEDIEARGDEDYNDIIFQIEILPMPMGVAQYDGVIPGERGLESDRGSRGVEAHLQSAKMAKADFERSSQLYRMPESGEITLSMVDDRSSMKFDLCVFDYEKLMHLNPASLDFRVAAARSARSMMDDREANVGSKLTFDPAAYGLQGKIVGFLFVPNNTVSTFLRNPWRYTARGNGVRTKRQPMFSLVGANPGAADQMFSFNDGSRTLLFAEDHARGDDGTKEAGKESDSSFDDIAIALYPALEMVDHRSSKLAAPSTDTTHGFTWDDGHAPYQPGDPCKF